MRNTENTPDRSRPRITTIVLPTEPLDGSKKSAIGRKEVKIVGSDTTIGTWNVRTLHGTKKVKELTYVLSRYKWDIVGRNKVDRRRRNINRRRPQVMVQWGKRKTPTGIAFIVRKEITDCVKNRSENRLTSCNYAMLPTTIPDEKRSPWKPTSTHPYDRPSQGMN